MNLRLPVSAGIKLFLHPIIWLAFTTLVWKFEAFGDARLKATAGYYGAGLKAA
jgi:hypothetical protein